MVIVRMVGSVVVHVVVAWEDSMLREDAYTMGR